MSKPGIRVALSGQISRALSHYEFGLTDLRPAYWSLQSYASRFAEPVKRRTDPLIDLMVNGTIFKFLRHSIEVDRAFAAPVNLAHQPTIQIGVSSSSVFAKRSECVEALRQGQNIGPYLFWAVVVETEGPTNYYDQKFGQSRFVAKHLIRPLAALDPAGANDRTGCADDTPKEPKYIRWVSCVSGSNVCARRKETSRRTSENDFKSVGICHCYDVAGNETEVQPS